MKKFKFRLQRILDYRNLLKEEQKRDVMHKSHTLVTAEQRLEEILEAQDNSGIPQGEELTMAELSLTGEYQQYLHDALERQRGLVNEANDALDLARDVYVEKAVDAEVLETLKQKRKDQHYEKQLREVRKKIGDYVTSRHQFNQSSLGGQGDE